MLFAYTISLESPHMALAELRAAVDELNATLLPPGYGLCPRWSAAEEEGADATAVRGYEPDVAPGHMLALVQALRQLSRRFPDVTISLSGGHGLMPTQLRGGAFEMFADAYERALATSRGWGTMDERVWRIPS